MEHKKVKYQKNPEVRLLYQNFRYQENQGSK